MTRPVSTALVVSACLSCHGTLFAQAPTLVKDLTTTRYDNNGGDPDPAVSLGGDMYFAATATDTGRELYKSIAGTGTPTLVLDLVPGQESSQPNHLTAVGGVLYFTVDLPTGESELWSTNGTAVGTVKMIDLPSLAWGMAAWKGKLFVGCVGLVITDGTTLGTALVPRVFLAAEMTVAGNFLYFRASSLAYGWELWRTDGTVNGTTIVKDINPGKQSWVQTATTGLFAMGSKLLFFATEPTHGKGFWVTDGTSAGTKFLADLDGFPGNPFSEPSGYATLGAKIFFGGETATRRGGLWVTDGTVAGTKQVKDTGTQPSNPLRIGNAIYFTSNQGFWRSDGTTNGTVIVKAIAPGLFEPQVVASGSTMFFAAAPPTSAFDVELWKSDGTSTGTVLVADISPGRTGSYPYRFTVAPNGRVLFVGVMPNNAGNEMFVTDGTKAGTRILGDIQSNPAHTKSSEITMSDVDGLAVIDTRVGIWRSGGTANSTTRVRAGRTNGWAGLGRHFVFGQGNRLLRDDGLVLNTFPSIPWFEPHSFRTVGRFVYFVGSDNVYGEELWRTDGTVTGTVRVSNFVQPASQPTGVTPFGGKVYCSAIDSRWPQRNIYVSDPKTNVTTLLDPLKAKTPWISASLIGAGSKLMWNGSRVTSTGGLWISDGTAAGSTFLAAGITATWYEVVEIGNLIFFDAIGTWNAGLWCTDGTPAGTRRLSTIQGTQLTAHNGRLLFFADDGANGLELWTSDGTSTGTKMLKDIWPGSLGLNAVFYERGGQPLKVPGSNIISVGQFAYFGANDGVHGGELWRTDGTTAGTAMVHDALPGSASSWPRNLVLSRGRLLFSAVDAAHGRELFSFEPGPHTQNIGSSCSAGSPPTVRASIPRLGSILSVDVQSALAKNVGGAMVLGTLPARPLDVGTSCALYPDLGPGVLVFAFKPDSSGKWSLRTSIPNTPVLKGLTVAAQVGIGPTQQLPLNTDFSRGLLLHIER